MNSLYTGFVRYEHRFQPNDCSKTVLEITGAHEVNRYREE